MTSYSCLTNKDRKFYCAENFTRLSIATLLIHEGKIDYIASR